MDVKAGELLECDDANCEGCRGEADTPEEEAWAVVAVAHCLRGYDKTERDCYFRKWHKVEDTQTGKRMPPPVLDDVVGEGRAYSTAQMQKVMDWYKRLQKEQCSIERTCKMRRVEYVLVRTEEKDADGTVTAEDRPLALSPPVEREGLPDEAASVKGVAWTDKTDVALREYLLFLHHDVVAGAGGPDKVRIDYPPFK